MINPVCSAKLGSCAADSLDSTLTGACNCDPSVVSPQRMVLCVVVPASEVVVLLLTTT